MEEAALKTINYKNNIAREEKNKQVINLTNNHWFYMVNLFKQS